MSTSTSSVNPVLTTLIQNLTAVNSPLLSSSKAMDAIEKASTSDLVKISNEAIELRGVNALFGDSTSSDSTSSSTDLLSTLYQPTTSSDSLESLLSAVTDSSDTDSSSSTSTSTSATSLATALSSYTQGLNTNEIESLFGSSDSTGIFG